MTTYALLIVVAYLAWDRWQARCIVDRAAAIIECGSPDLEAMIALVDRLAQRIQAPEIAVAEHTAVTLPVQAPEHVPMDDDEAFWATKENLAEMAMADEMSNGAAR